MQLKFLASSLLLQFWLSLICIRFVLRSRLITQVCTILKENLKLWRSLQRAQVGSTSWVLLTSAAPIMSNTEFFRENPRTKLLIFWEKLKINSKPLFLCKTKKILIYHISLVQCHLSIFLKTALIEYNHDMSYIHPEDYSSPPLLLMTLPWTSYFCLLTSLTII